MEKSPPKSPGWGRPTEALSKKASIIFEVACGACSANDFLKKKQEGVLKTWETRAKAIPKVAP
jgi:hypothetical protein